MEGRWITLDDGRRVLLGEGDGSSGGVTAASGKGTNGESFWVEHNPKEKDSLVTAGTEVGGKEYTSTLHSMVGDDLPIWTGEKTIHITVSPADRAHVQRVFAARDAHLKAKRARASSAGHDATVDWQRSELRGSVNYRDMPGYTGRKSRESAEVTEDNSMELFKAVAESLVRLSVFGQGSAPEVKHVAADWCAVGVNDKTYRVGFTTAGSSYAFGRPVLMTVAEAEALPAPDPARESFTAKESEQIQFTVAEGVNIDGEIYHAKPDAGEYPVFIVAEGVNRGKKRQYTGKCMESVTSGFYDGVPMFLDHVGEEGKVTVRSVRDLAGKVLKSGRAIVHEGVKKIPGVVRFMGWAKEQAKDPDWRAGVGLSHVADVSGYLGKVGKDTMRVIESIVHPYSVDVVSSAAFGGKVMESNGVDSRVEDLTMLETLKIEDLSTHRPDLVTAIKESARVEFRVQESDDAALTAEKTRADAAVAEAKTAKAELHKVRVAEAVTAEVAKAEYKIPEAARPLIVDRLKTRLGAGEISPESLSATVTTAVKEEVALGAAFVPAKATPSVPPNKGGNGEPTAKAKLQERFDRTGGLVPPKAQVS